MPEELIDIFDENNNPLNKTKAKNETYKKGLYHRAIQICIYNSKKEILLQLRSKNKSIFPNLWDISVSGHVKTKEKPIESAIRELKEELGLEIKKENLKFFKIKKINRKIKNLFYRGFYYIYFLKYNNDINTLKLQKEEVSNIKFININLLENQLKTDKENFVPHEDYWFELIEEIKKQNP